MDMFLGVVSHPGSRFAQSQSADGFPARLARALGDRSVPVELIIETRNLFTENPRPLLPSDVQESLDAQLDLERDWARYVHGSASSSFRKRMRHLLLRLGRLRRRVRPPVVGTLERLLNIEFSHISLLQRGIASGAPWIVILEDDADCVDVADCAAGIAGLTSSAPDSVAYVNLSESFDLDELDVQPLLHASGSSWQGSVQRSILSADKPITNTVCAIAYRRDFARDLLAEFERQGSFPVLPIDWKLNLALMTMHARGNLREGSCWWIQPAPIAQMSMRALGDGDSRP